MFSTTIHLSHPYAMLYVPSPCPTVVYTCTSLCVSYSSLLSPPLSSLSSLHSPISLSLRPGTAERTNKAVAAVMAAAAFEEKKDDEEATEEEEKEDDDDDDDDDKKALAAAIAAAAAGSAAPRVPPLGPAWVSSPTGTRCCLTSSRSMSS